MAKHGASGGLWTAYEAAAATGGALCARGGDPTKWVAEEWAANGVSIDSRTLAPGEIFVALQDARDGHDFVAAAFERGASAALVARAPEDAPDGKPLLLVRDTFQGLRDLARAARNRNFGKRIAVTGSAGKTSTKEMLRAVFSEIGRVHAADKSFNNHFGVPLTLARMPLAVDFGVFEIGMNHAGEITPLTHLVAPDVAIVTTVGAAHLENFASIEGISEAKAEIFQGVGHDGVAIIPGDNEFAALLERRARECGIRRIVRFGSEPQFEVQLKSYSSDGVSAEISATVYGRAMTLRLAAPGRHQAMNAMAVLAAVQELGQPIEAAVKALGRARSTSGRGAQKALTLSGGRQVTLLDESYNANPTSVAAAVRLFADIPAKRRIAVIGDMLELGPESPRLHAAIADQLVEAKVDRLYLAGELVNHLWDAAPASMRAARTRTAAELFDALLADLKDGDSVIVKGSNGSKVSEIVRRLIADAEPKT